MEINVRPFIRRLMLIVPLLACSCGQPDADQPRTRLTIFATIYPLAEVAREIGGADASVDWLIELGKPLNGFALTRHERDRLASTDFTLCDSFHRTETWAAPDLVQRQNTSSILPVENLPVVSSVPNDGLLYLDPIVMRQYITSLAEAFDKAMPEKATPDHAAGFHKRADALIAQIDQVVAQYPNRSFGDSKIVVLAPTFAPLLARFGIGSILVDRDVYRLSVADLAAIRKAADLAEAKSVLVPFDLPPGAVSRIESQTGLKAFAIDALGFTGFKGHDTYVDLLQYDLAQLQQATAAK